MTALRSLGFAFLCSVGVTACNGGTSSVSPISAPTSTPSPAPTASPGPANATTLAVTSAASTSALPTVNGGSASVSFGAVSPPPGATIAVTVSTTPPAGVTALQNVKRATKSVTRTTLAYVTWTPSVTISLTSFPAFSFTFPASLVPAGTTLHEAFLDGSTAQPVWQLDIAFGANGGTLTSSASAPTLQAGKQYVFVIYIETGATPGTPSPTVAPTTAPTSPPVSGAFLNSPISITKVANGFPTGGAFYEGAMTLASDGQLWLADQRTKSVRPLDPVAQVLGAGYPFKPPGAPSTIRPAMITSGSDNRLWIVSYDDTSDIIAMSLSGTIEKYDSRNPAQTNYVYRLAPGPDGRLWGIAADSLRVFTTAGAKSVYPLPGTRTGNDCQGITVSTDGNMWYSCLDAVGKVTPAGVITEYKGHGSTFIGAAPDGALWIQGSGQNVGRVALDGTYKEFPLAAYETGCTSIVQGTDGAMYLGCSSTLFRIVSTGASTGSMTVLADYRTPGYTTGFSALTVGPDRRSLWSVSDASYAQLLR
jgi:streptogramin lyase